MKLGVPTLCRYDLLAKLLRSAEEGSELPSGYIIVDNGSKLSVEKLRRIITRDVSIQLVSPGENWGVARSWNHILELIGDESVVISNDDIVFKYRTFEELSEAVKNHPFVEGLGWALFAQSRKCIDTIGWYDCNFYPAYYEDTDYDLRLTRAGITPFCALSEPVEHFGWATTKGLPPADAEWLNAKRAKNREYFIKKWGNESPNPRFAEGVNTGILHYKEPFDGNMPIGWRGEREPMLEYPSMRWEIINHIAKKIKAKRYLEIGVNDGRCMRKVNIAEKWGIDPNPLIEAVQSSDVFIPQTSDSFFEKIGKHVGKFDLVFIDGDHRAEQVYREVQNIIPLLTPRGIIVLHDCSPQTEAMQAVPYDQGDWTGDVWKAIARLRGEGQHLIRVVNSDFGVGIIVPNLTEENNKVDWENLCWLDLEQNRTKLLGLLEPSEWGNWFDAICSNKLEISSKDETAYA